MDFNITVGPLKPEDYRAAFDLLQWDCSFEHYVNCLNLPSYLNFGIYDDARLIAAINLERISATVARFHVAKLQGAITPQMMTEILLNMGDYLFTQGFEICEAAIPPEREAAARLAMRCGLREVGMEDGDRIFRITQKERANGRSKT